MLRTSFCHSFIAVPIFVFQESVITVKLKLKKSVKIALQGICDYLRKYVCTCSNFQNQIPS